MREAAAAGLTRRAVRVLAASIIVAFTGCASDARAPAEAGIEPPAFEAEAGGTRISVRLDQGGQVDADSAPFPFVAWVVAAPVSAVAGAPVSSGMSVIAMPFLVAADAWVRLTRADIARALAETPIAPAIGAALVGRLGRRPEAGLDSAALTIRGFGLRARDASPNLASPGSQVCFALDGELSLAVRGTTRRLPLRLGPGERSADLPPPICGTLSAFAAGDGALTRSTVRESAALVAAWIALRARDAD